MAGSPLVVGVLAAVALAGLSGVAATSALAESQRLAAAADAAALAGGDALLGWIAGDPCATAARLAEANGASLAACRVDGLDVVVTVAGRVLGQEVRRSARAGPPP